MYTDRKLDFRRMAFGLSSHESKEGSYLKKHVVWRAGDLISLQSRLEGAIGNKAGYQSAEIAARVERDTRELLAEGHVHYFSSVLHHVGIHAVFQLYSEKDGVRDWCEWSLEMSHVSPREVLNSARVLNRLKNRKIDTPDDLISALRKLGPTYAVGDYKHHCQLVTGYPNWNPRASDGRNANSVAAERMREGI